MDTQTLQRLRTELEAASTLHLALGRLAQRASPTAPTAWTGPLLEELEELAADDGSFSHASLADIRRRSGSALVAQFHAVVAALAKAPAAERPGLQKLLDAVLVTGTQDSSIPASASIPGVLSSLSRSAGLQLEATMRAAMLARDGLPPEAPPAPKAEPKKTEPKKAEPKKTEPKKTEGRKPTRAVAKKKPAASAKKKAPARPVAKKARRPPTKPASARKSATARPGKAKKPSKPNR
ncbi:MAG: hypothetical protein SFW67_18570 [Myxococcaceae bacterium]|nr:hypothetical protein [Myxococcaceae bacterium]